jgi:hypothetical protein
MAGHARKGHSGEGGRGACEPVARAAPLSLADAMVAIMRDPKVKLPPPYDAPTPPASLRSAPSPEGEGEEKKPRHDSPVHVAPPVPEPAPVAAEPPRVTRSPTAARDHDVERIVSDPHPGFRWI